MASLHSLRKRKFLQANVTTSCYSFWGPAVPFKVLICFATAAGSTMLHAFLQLALGRIVMLMHARYNDLATSCGSSENT